ncbi:DMT family transporter [Kushneria marisflavi]|uniref:EamA family transporter n=1 Tax=Kushneria marisflavi TaxID=157779 RepID=A0A240UT93_9GAMM|nr:EamA family transporter [Kushneria marisflavi]ART64356.1 EamA family transporter [Kushneria marisflavi]RKD76824.1 DME family drug/metabolite transporter [Kushneria marisflavi]
MNTPARERLLGVAGVLLAAVLWGTTGTAATLAPEVSAIAIGAVAMGIGGLLQALVAAPRIRKTLPPLRARWPWLLSGAVAVAIYPLAFYGSMRLAGVTIGTVVSIGSAPLLSALIESRFDGLRLGARWKMGATLGLVGMALLCLAETEPTTGVGSTTQVLQGVVMGLVAGLTYAFYSWSARRLMQRGIPPRAAMGATFGLGGLILMPVLLLTGAPLLGSINNAAVGLYMALVPMFLGYLGFGYGLARVPASTATTITLFEPVVAALLAVVIVGERLPLLGWAGIVLVVACLVCLTAPVRWPGAGTASSTP